MAINVNQFSFQYPHHKKILNQLSFKIKDGEFVLLTGPSGSGKSTLLKWLSRLYPKFIDQKYNQSGTIKINQQLLSQIASKDLSKNIVMMFQNPNHQFTMLTVQEEMVFALENQQTNPKDINHIIKNVLTKNRLEAFRYRKIRTLSGGEKQQIALAIIMAMNSKIILLDEPFANVDFKARQKLLNILKHLKTQGKTILIIDHDLSDYQDVIDRYLYLNPAGELSTYDQITKLPNYKYFEKHPQTFKMPTTVDQAVFNLKDLQLSRNQSTLLKTSHFKFFMNKITLLTGDNGVGKSTLFDSMIKLLKYKGLIQFHNQNIAKIKKKKYFADVGMTFQDVEEQFLEITLKEEINLSFKNAHDKEYSQAEINKWLQALNLDQHLNQVVYSLSEGQKKKLQIMIMLIMHPQVLLMDEPFKGIDYASLKVIFKILKAANQKHHQTIIIISHQLMDMDQLVDYHVQFKNQKLIYSRRLQ